MKISLANRLIQLMATAVLALGISPAFAQLAGSDSVTVYDGNGDVVEFLAISEADEIANGPGFVYVLQTRIDVNQFGNYTTLYDDPLNPNSIGDIFGVVFSGNGSVLAFASDVDGIDFSQTFGGPGPNNIFEGSALVFDMTMYLAADLRADGWTAEFRSDFESLAVPEPLPLGLLAVAGAALLLTRRKPA